MVRNILFIMADQLRRDHLSCYGARHLDTPNLDALAADGVRFERAYVQGPVCGVSRMSAYTGRYMSTHGSNWNFVPLPLHNPTMGSLLRPQGLRVAVVGKTHIAGDAEGLRRFGADPARGDGLLAHQGGFEPYERDDGLWPGPRMPADQGYARYLRAQGFGGDNPWHDWANSARGAHGEVLSGWEMRHAHLPAAVPEEHSETAWMTRRAMDFIDECGEQPWCLHLSYIKPHWPYVAPDPYHALYREADLPAPVRSAAERDNPHPVMRGFQSYVASRNMSDDAMRRHVLPAYMGLTRQIDDHLGRLFAHLKRTGRWDDTLIVFCSDHGDYLGDHWLGEKELFHDTVAAVPLIVRHPGASARRGVSEPELVELIDLLPTFLDAIGAEVPDHLLEGRSLVPLLLQGQPRRTPRELAVSEGDYAFRSFVREPINQPADRCRMFMIRSERWKYIHYEGLPPQLFDLLDDPQELVDRGRDPGLASVRDEHFAALFDWLRTRAIHPTVSHQAMADWTAKEHRVGIHIGVW
jgi:arylsulfatase A-like enzyme